ncbi:MAG TPA: hypothetical protein VN238_22790 [Solirubrobacteraceae bacterium]|nr:hypothetical protein [Solirubrobacteraceae bacterium]
MSDPPIPPDVLRSALLDPSVRKHRVLARLPGRRVDADDLHRTLTSRLPGRTITAEQLDDALRTLGARPIGPGRLARHLAGRRGKELPRPALYWFSQSAWQHATRRRPRGEARDG